MSPRALITGVAGQDGTYLTELLAQKGYQVFGVVGPRPAEGADCLGQYCSFEPVEADLTKGDSLDDVIRRVRPDEVYNFAAISSVSESWTHLAAVADVNATGVARLLEALRRHAPQARLCQAVSAEIFGNSSESPQTESTPIHPVTPYGAAKAYAHFLMRIAREGMAMFTCSAILYNHESPRRPLDFVTRKITDGVARIHYGLDDRITLGNVDAARDWGFAGDYVEGMWRMLQQPVADDYIFATGDVHTVGEFCDLAFSHVGLNWRDHVVVDEALCRVVDRISPVGDATKAHMELGWRPQTSLRQLVAMMMDADLARYQAHEHDGTSLSESF